MKHREITQAFEKGEIVSVSSGYSKEWGRIASLGRIIDPRTPRAKLALVEVFQHRANILIPKADIRKQE